MSINKILLKLIILAILISHTHYFFSLTVVAFAAGLNRYKKDAMACKV